MKYIIQLILIVGIVNLLFAQNNITIKQDPSLPKLINRHIEMNTSIRRVQGWRIQLSSNTERTEVMNIKSSFLTQYPTTKTYLTYQQPYFKLRVGDFADKNEAYQFMKEINENFKGIFIVPDIVNVMPEGVTEDK
ncbi:MAG: hypothetical protein RL065_1207 [Bacteroidota bacterium]|jgi:hypothetical protein